MEKLRKRQKRTIYNSKFIICNSIYKIIVILIIIGLNWTGILAISKTLAYFNDTEDSSSNIYQTGTLDFSLRSGQGNFVPESKAGNMRPGDKLERNIQVINDGTLPLQYTARTEKILGDDDLCNALWLEAKLEGEEKVKYEGSLMDFNFDPFELITPPGIDTWQFKISLPSGASGDLQNKSCQFKFVFDGWQIDFSDPSSGFSDTEEISNSVATGNWQPEVTVIHPNGGEGWYIVPDSCPTIPWCSEWCQNQGMNANCEYPIQWTATNLIGPNMDLLIDIHFSRDSGSTWMSQIADDTENDGTFWWKIPYDMSYVTDNGRIKVTATHRDYSSLTNWDVSDSDFCPPMLTESQIFQMFNLLGPGSPVEKETPVREGSTTEEEPALEESPEEIFSPVTEEPIIEPIIDSVETTSPGTEPIISSVETTTPEEDGINPPENFFNLAPDEPLDLPDVDSINTVTPQEEGIIIQTENLLNKNEDSVGNSDDAEESAEEELNYNE